jgi:hypothetical protein
MRQTAPLIDVSLGHRRPVTTDEEGIVRLRALKTATPSIDS